MVVAGEQAIADALPLHAAVSSRTLIAVVTRAGVGHEQAAKLGIADVVCAGVLVIGAAAGALQLNLVQGDRGLGSFLSDGKGLGKSGYKPLTPAAAEEQDRQKLNGIKLPFRLPNLDFVDVYDEEGRVVATDDGVPVPSEEDMEDDGIRLG